MELWRRKGKSIEGGLGPGHLHACSGGARRSCACVYSHHVLQGVMQGEGVSVSGLLGALLLGDECPHGGRGVRHAMGEHGAGGVERDVGGGDT